MGVMPYAPAVPDGSSVTEISDEQYNSIFTDKTHYFDPAILTVISKTQEALDEAAAIEAQRTTNTTNSQFLNNTDWKVLRHIREKALSQSTSLTDAEYLALEQARADAAAAIVEIQ